MGSDVLLIAGPLEIALILLAGGMAGLIGGLFGLGGGVVLIPFFTLALGLPIKTAVGTSLCAVVANSLSAAARRLPSGEVELRAATWLEPTMLLGSLVAASVAPYLSERLIVRVFAAVIGLMLLFMILRGDSEGPEDQPREALVDARGRPRQALRWTLLQAIFGFGGIASGLLGIGGGAFMIPGLSALGGVPMRRAASTSNYAMSLGASGGAVVYLVLGWVNTTLLGCVVLGGVVGTRLGVMLLRVMHARALRWAFVLVMAAIWTQMWLKH